VVDRLSALLQADEVRVPMRSAVHLYDIAACCC
jgi:hypothetical protein